MALFRCLALTAVLACLLTAPQPSTAGHHQQGNNHGLETLLVTGVLAKVLEKKGGGGKHPIYIPVYVPVGGGHHKHHHKSHGGHHHHHKSYGSESHYMPESRMPYPMALPPQPMMPGLQQAANQILFDNAMQQESMDMWRQARASAQNSDLVDGVDISDFQPKNNVMVYNINV